MYGERVHQAVVASGARWERVKMFKGSAKVEVGCHGCMLLEGGDSLVVDVLRFYFQPLLRPPTSSSLVTSFPHPPLLAPP